MTLVTEQAVPVEVTPPTTTATWTPRRVTVAI